jgi:hypothetical protein
MIDIDTIRPQMPVVGSEDAPIAVVDRLVGDEMIELTQDAQGLRHYIPMQWVTAVDDKVHLDRPVREAMREWSLTPPCCFANGHLA